MQPSAVKRSAIILCAVAVFQAALIAIFPSVFLPPLTAHLERATALGWVLALAVAAGYITYSIRGLPTIGKYLWNVSAFKLSGLAIAIPAAILEEVFFRAYVMNALVAYPWIVQILASALSFGIAHAVWGIGGGRRALLGAVGSTSLMGAALAVVYLASNRVVLPCVVSHFLITAILEPWLIYAYIERRDARAGAAG